jgi:bacterioferritin-associated ferredoxin
VFVCICNGLRERQVCAQREKGVRDAGEVFAALDCEPRCATCVPEITALLAEVPPGEPVAAVA